MGRAVGVFSGKGGVGKTTLVANLGASLTKVFDKNVVIFDNNIHTSHLGLHLGLYDDLPVTLREVLKKKVPLAQAVYIHPATGIRVIPAPLNGDGLVLTKEICASLVRQVRNNYDMVILDCAPGLGNEVIAPMSCIDDAIVISTPDLAALTDALKTIELLKKLRKNVLGIVINRYRGEKYELTPAEVASTANQSVLAVIPEDSRVPESISKGLPVVLSFPNSKSSSVLKRLSATISGETYHEESLFEKIRNMFGSKSYNQPIKPVQYTRLQPTRQTAQHQSVKQEAADISNMKTELMEEIKKELKREIIKKVKRKMGAQASGY